MRALSFFRYLFIACPLMAAFFVLELLHRRRIKDHVLFVVPYDEYDENTRYLFELCRARRLFEQRAVLFVFHKELYATLRERFGDDVVYARSRRGFDVFFRAVLAFTSRGAMINAFYPYYFSMRFKFFVNLWHGIPLKRIGRLARHSWESVLKLEVKHYGAMISCSVPEQLAMALAYDLKMDSVWVTDSPRNDPLCAAVAAARQVPRVRPFTILYAPTYRDGAMNTELFPFPDFDEAKLRAFLAERGARMIIRRHLLERELWNQEDVQSDGTIVLDDRHSLYDSLQQELIESDALITDYSSVYLDYVILDRPMIFVPYDRAWYEEKRGLVFDYDRVTPGPKVDSFAQMLEAIDEAINKPEARAESRRAVRAYFHEHLDGRAGERIVARALRELDQRKGMLPVVQPETSGKLGSAHIALVEH
jgi:CDP-glycerol glycerophosphotransferase (TagB/SpsB family)